MTALDRPALPHKAALIDEALARYDIRSMVDLGGCWGVNGAYLLGALERGKLDRALLVDGTITPLTRERGSVFPQLELVEAALGDEQTVETVGKVDAAIMFDILLHQVAPDWDEFLARYAANVDTLIIYNQGWLGPATIRFADLGVDAYLERVFHVDETRIRAWFDEHGEWNAEQNKSWRDVHNFWQWGITQDALVGRLWKLGYRVDLLRNDGLFDPRFREVEAIGLIARKRHLSPAPRPALPAKTAEPGKAPRTRPRPARAGTGAAKAAAPTAPVTRGVHFDTVAAAVEGVLHMTPQQGRTIYDFVLAQRPRRVLELGFAHGVSSCYIAAALEEAGGPGRLLTIDQKGALVRRPSIGELLARCGLEHRVKTIFADTSYTWELLRLLRRPKPPAFDFAFIDGAHTWDVDGFAFQLVDRMLRPGGWILFDDLDWSLASSPSLRDADWVRALPREQQQAAQVGQVFDLLVRTHREYTNFRVEDGWGWAQKRPARSGNPTEQPVGSPVRAARGKAVRYLKRRSRTSPVLARALTTATQLKQHGRSL